MDKMLRCPKCKKKYVFFGTVNNVSVCPECLAVESMEYEIVREYVRANKGCTMNEVCAATSIHGSKILRFLREEKLEIVGENNYLRCEACGAFINTGRFCPNCSKNMGTMVIGKTDGIAAQDKWRTSSKHKVGGNE